LDSGKREKYVLHGIRLLFPLFLILIFVLVLASIITLLAPPNIEGYPGVSSAVNAISASPFNGQSVVQIPEVAGGSINLTWGFGIGAYLLLFAGILLIMAGVMEMTAHEQFFEEKSQCEEKRVKKKIE
jgi:hypothetical protein